MKKLSKIIALLLAGAMAMLMFTACSGGGGGSEDKEAEEKVMSQIRGKSTSTASLQNDKDLQKVAAAHLDEDLKGGISIFGHKLVGNVHVEGKDKEYLTITVTANYTYTDTLLSAILTEISKKVSTDANVDIQQSGSWSKVGVVVKTSNTKSYVGIAFQIKNPIPQKYKSSQSFRSPESSRPPGLFYSAKTGLLHLLWYSSPAALFFNIPLPRTRAPTGRAGCPFGGCR